MKKPEQVNLMLKWGDQAAAAAFLDTQDMPARATRLPAVICTRIAVLEHVHQALSKIQDPVH